MELTSGWKAHLLRGPFDSLEARDLLSSESFDAPPQVVHVYRCECCNRPVIVNPGHHPNESELGAPTVYVLDAVLGTDTALYVYTDDLVERAQKESFAEFYGLDEPLPSLPPLVTA